MNNREKIKVKILGCGSSTGSPLPGCFCKTCVSDDEKNFRTRSSIYVEYDGYKILIDAGQDLKFQMMKAGLSHFDLVLYTHQHSDHISGSNDLILSVINTKQSLNVFATQAVMERLMINFDYLFKPLRNPNFNKDGSFEGIEPQASLISNIFGEYDEIQLQNKKIRCFKQNHGSVDSIGFEFGNGKFVYSPDLKFLPEKTIDFLRSLEIDLWVLPLTHIKGNKNHIGLDEIMDLIRLIKPKRVVLIHMNHSIEYYELKDMLCESEIQIEPGFDGMEFEI